MGDIAGSKLTNPTPSATITLTIDPSASHILASWTAGQNETINCSGTPQDGQQLSLLITNDLTPRTITFGTGFSASATVIGIASKKSLIRFLAIGGTFYEASRTIGALN